MRKKIGILFTVFALMVSSFSGVYAFAEGSTTVTVSEAVKLENESVYLRGKVNNPADNQELTIIAVKLEDGVYNGNNSVYIDQQKSLINDDGTFSITFNPKTVLDSDSEYIIRVGGTGISEFSEMKITMDGGGNVSGIYMGDVNGDGSITVNDASLVLQYVLDPNSINGKIGEISVSEFLDRADVYGNKKITAVNAGAILQKALGSFEFVRKDGETSSEETTRVVPGEETSEGTTSASGGETSEATTKDVSGGETPDETTTEDIIIENPEFDGDALVDCHLASSDKENNKFKTISEAVASIKTTPTENDRFEIDIMPGVYREQVYLTTPYVTLRKNPKYSGEVKLTWYYGMGSLYDSANDKGYYDPSCIGDGKLNKPSDWGAALKVDKPATGTIVMDMTFENSYNQYYTKEELNDNLTVDPDVNNSMFDRRAWIEEQIANGESDEYINKWIQSRTNVYAYTNSAGEKKTTSPRERAAAFHCSADKFEAYNCTFIGKQDTMGINSGREYYENCTLKGTVDYICGSATAVFNNCELVIDSGIDMHSDKLSLDQKAASDSGYITAPSTNAEDKGYLFYKCRITASEHIGSSQGTFGRPWGKPGGPEAIYYKTTIGKNKSGNLLISDTGWDDMSGCKKDQARFFEFGSVDESGNAVNISKRVKNTVAPFGTVLDEWHILEFNPYEYTKGNDGWDPMRIGENYTEFDQVLNQITFPSEVSGNSIALPAAPSGYKYYWESDTEYAKVGSDQKSVNVIRPAYGSEPISAKLTVYIKKDNSEYGVKKTVSLTIKPNESKDNTFNVTGTVTLGSAAEKDVIVDIKFIQNSAVVQNIKATVTKGQTSGAYTAEYLPEGEYSVYVSADTDGFRVIAPADGRVTVSSGAGVNKNIDIDVRELKEVTVKTEDFSESWAKWTPTVSNENVTATVVEGTDGMTANIGTGNKVMKFTKAENKTVNNTVGFSFDWQNAVKASGGTLDNTNIIKFSYDLLLEKDKNDENGGYMAGEYSFIDFTTKLGTGNTEKNMGRYARYGIYTGWNQLNFFSALNSRINGDNTQFDTNSKMKNKWYHIVTDVDLKNNTIIVHVYDRDNDTEILNKSKEPFTIAKPNEEGENPEYPAEIVKDALYTAVYMDKGGNTKNRIEFYIDNMELTYQDFK